MTPLDSRQIEAILQAEFPEGTIISSNHDVAQPFIVVKTDKITAVATFLRDDPRLYFDFLNCLSGVDSGPAEGKLSVVYHMMSIPHGHRLVLKVVIEREMPEPVPSLANIWLTANWHEREAYDLVGIPFSGHPDLRRILMPNDWNGHPLRKDYVDPDSYHGIQIQY